MTTPDRGTMAPLGSRRTIVATIGLTGLWAFIALGLTPAVILPSLEELRTLGGFAARALNPALSYESAFVPQDSPPLLLRALDGAQRTVVFAATSMSLALVGGVALGFLASTAWWAGDPGGGRTLIAAWLRRTAGPAVYGTTRVVIGLMRSVHELLWAVLFLAAIGLSDLTAVIAIAIPYTGILAKLFSEIIDEAPRDAAHAFRAAGARPAQVYLFGLLPRALPDMGAYALYRFECALRSSAILGFFGPETLGKFIKQSWNEGYHGEVWTYLYTLFALIAVVDWWSGHMRRRFVA